MEDEWDLRKLLSDAEKKRQAETPSLAVGGESATVPSSGESTQGSATTTQSDATATTQAPKMVSPESLPRMDTAETGTPDPPNDLAADIPDPSPRVSEVAPSAGGDGSTPFPEPPAEDFSSVERAVDTTEPDWPEVNPPLDVQPTLTSLPTPRDIEQDFGGNQNQSAPMPPQPQTIQPIFNVTVTSGDDMMSKLNEEITPRLQQFQQQTQWYADSAVADYTDLMSLAGGGDL